MKFISRTTQFHKAIYTYQVEDNENYEEQLNIQKQKVDNSCFGGYVTRGTDNRIIIAYYTDWEVKSNGKKNNTNNNNYNGVYFSSESI